MTVGLEEILISVWRQAFVEDAGTVGLESGLSSPEDESLQAARG
jgi:hypothetical protein